MALGSAHGRMVQVEECQVRGPEFKPKSRQKTDMSFPLRGLTTLSYSTLQPLLSQYIILNKHYDILCRCLLFCPLNSPKERTLLGVYNTASHTVGVKYSG
jgi:hypothetical protein